MKPLSVSTAAVAAVLFFLCTSFSSNNAGRKASQFASARESGASKAAVSKATYYYFYTYPGDTFDAYNDVIDECANLEVELQVPVDTNPFDGGVQIMKGYINNDYPHMVLPSQHLYAHYAD
ncbi:MAG TPA: hypothetical protein VHW43_05640 [Puia sp.]|nr:hypothetical protein [Puia sp.]